MSFTTVPVIKRVIWDRQKLPAAELETRVEKLRELADNKGLIGVFVYGDALYSGDLSYFTNYSCHIAWRNGLLYLPAVGKPSLFLKVPARDIPYIQDVTPIEAKVCKGLAEAVSGVLKSEKGRFGVVGFENIPYIEYVRMAQELSEADTMDLTSKVRVWRSRKTETEKAVMREVGEIADACMSVLMDKAVAGGKTHLLTAEADYLARRMGCQQVQVMYGRNGGVMVPGAEFELADDDVLSVTLSLQHMNYWVYMLRTVKIGGDRGAAFSGLSGYGSLAAAVADKAYSPAFGIGLDLEELPKVTADGKKPEKDMAVRLRIDDCDGSGACIGDTVILNDGEPSIISASGTTANARGNNK